MIEAHHRGGLGVAAGDAQLVVVYDDAVGNRVESLFPNFFGGDDGLEEACVVERERHHPREVFNRLFFVGAELMRGAVADAENAERFAARGEGRERHVAHSLPAEH